MNVEQAYSIFAHFRKNVEPLTAFGILTSVYPVSWVITGTVVVTTYYIVRHKEFNKERSRNSIKRGH